MKSEPLKPFEEREGPKKLNDWNAKQAAQARAREAQQARAKETARAEKLAIKRLVAMFQLGNVDASLAVTVLALLDKNRVSYLDGANALLYAYLRHNDKPSKL